MISDKSIEEVKDRIDIVEVISDFVSLKKAGINYKARSPFNDEKTPSFFVAPNKGIYKDFSSGKGGDAINFVMEHEGLSYLEAIKYLAQKYGVELEESESSEEDLKLQNEKDSILIVLNLANEYFVDLIHNNEEGRSVGMSYLKERGLSESVINEFALGYSLDKWDGLLNYAVEKGYNEDILEKAGLIIRKEDKKYDRFRGRVMFPIHNLTGKVVAFGARILIKDTKQPKYINSPETDVYSKSNILYGLYQSKNDIRKQDNCYLVEGYTDVISMYQSGVKNVVSSSGTSLTDQQINLIKRYSQNITVLYDGDEAGIQASLRGVDMILEKGLNVKIVLLPDGEDPDSFVSKQGSTGFTEFIEKEAVDFITYKANYYAKKAGNDPSGKANAIREVVLSIVKIPDAIQRAVYLKESATLFNIDESILIAESNRYLLEERKKTRRKSEDKTDFVSVENEIVKEGKEKNLSLEDIIIDQELECIRLLVNYGNVKVEEDIYLHQYFFEETNDIEFLDALSKKILGIYLQCISKDIIPDHEYFMVHGDDEIKSKVAELYFERYTLSENWELKFEITVLTEEAVLDKIFSRNILLLKFRHTQRILEEKKEKLSNSLSVDEETEILSHLIEYKKFEMAYAKELGIIVSR